MSSGMELERSLTNL